MTSIVMKCTPRSILEMRKNQINLIKQLLKLPTLSLLFHFSASAKTKQYLKVMGITHVLNTAEGTRFGQVDTGHGYYRDMPSLRYAIRCLCINKTFSLKV